MRGTAKPRVKSCLRKVGTRGHVQKRRTGSPCGIETPTRGNLPGGHELGGPGVRPARLRGEFISLLTICGSDSAPRASAGRIELVNGARDESGAHRFCRAER